MVLNVLNHVQVVKCTGFVAIEIPCTLRPNKGLEEYQFDKRTEQITVIVIYYTHFFSLLNEADCICA